MRFLRRCGDLVSGCFRCSERPLLCEVLLLGVARGDSLLEARGSSLFVIGEAGKLNSADAPDIDP